jgi:hypothetical protein
VEDGRPGAGRDDAVPDAIVQEIVDRPGWSDGNAIVLMMKQASGAPPRRPLLRCTADERAAPRRQVRRPERSGHRPAGHGGLHAEVVEREPRRHGAGPGARCRTTASIGSARRSAVWRQPATIPRTAVAWRWRAASNTPRSATTRASRIPSRPDCKNFDPKNDVSRRRMRPVTLPSASRIVR